MEREYYQSPKPTALMRFFWRAAGGDRYFLEKSTYTDQVKYMCLGGIITATGVMAGLSGGYAFYTIFEPKGSSLDAEYIPLVSILSIIFGFLWGLMIFNLDRFIVSSTGKGDGTEAITWEEFKGALPRLVMGAIIALSISKPVEIRMFKSEIDAVLHERQLDLRKEYEKRTRATYNQRFDQVDAELQKFEDGRKDLVDRIEVAEKEYFDQLQGRAGRPGDGPLAKALKNVLDGLETKLRNLDKKNESRINELIAYKTGLQDELDMELGKNQQVASGLDGLLERLKLAHEIAGFWISFFITLLFLAIELTPIFFKLMLVKSPYDFMKENVEETIKAEHGIFIQHNYHKDKKGQERDLVQHIMAEKLLVERKALLKTQEELTHYAIKRYKEKMMARIDDDPEAFIRIEKEAKS